MRRRPVLKCLRGDKNEAMDVMHDRGDNVRDPYLWSIYKPF